MALNMTGINITQPSLLNVSAVTPQNYVETITPLVLFIIGIALYALFIFKFYRFLARRDLLKLKMHQWKHGFEGFIEKLYQIIVYIVEYLLVIPLLVFFWFIILAALILFLTKTHTPDTVLLIAMAIVGAVRVTAYYNEDLSRDLAKMIPFALLGVFIVDMNYFSWAEALNMAGELPAFLDKAIFYLVFVALVEFIMRIAYGITSSFRKKKKKEEIPEVLD